MGLGYCSVWKRSFYILYFTKFFKSYPNVNASVGDTITVNWDNGHDFYQFVDFANYNICDFANAKQAGQNPPVVVQATSPGIFYYGCTLPGHCSYGFMKIAFVITESVTTGGRIQITTELQPQTSEISQVTGENQGTTNHTGVTPITTGSNQGTSGVSQITGVTQMTTGPNQSSSGSNEGSTSGSNSISSGSHQITESSFTGQSESSSSSGESTLGSSTGTNENLTTSVELASEGTKLANAQDLFIYSFTLISVLLFSSVWLN